MNEPTARRPRRYLVSLRYVNGSTSEGYVWAYDAKDAAMQATLGTRDLHSVHVEPAPEPAKG